MSDAAVLIVVGVVGVIALVVAIIELGRHGAPRRDQRRSPRYWPPHAVVIDTPPTDKLRGIVASALGECVRTPSDNHPR